MNRSVNMAAKNFGAIPEPGDLTDADRALMERSRNAFRTVGAELERSRFKSAITEALEVVREANRYLSDQAPWKLKDDPARVQSILHTALQVVDDAKSLLTPFLRTPPRRSTRCSVRRVGGMPRSRPSRRRPRLPRPDRRLRDRGALGVHADCRACR